MKEKNKNLINEKKKKMPFNVFSKKGLMALAMAGVMIASPLMLAGCSDGKNGADGTRWESGLSYTEFTDAKVGDFFIDTDDYILYKKTATDWEVVMRDYGKPGANGQDGQTATVSINSDGYWVINGTPTTTKATGEDGNTPYVHTDGYWYIDGTSTGVKAQGEQGLQGNAGKSAFELYQQENPSYTGTLQDWLESLKGQNGTNGTNGATWLNGTVDPTNEGEDGDFYLNTTTYDIYKKIDGTWTKQGNIKGKDAEQSTEMMVDLVMFMGQSNMAGRGDYTQATTVPTGHGYEFRAVSDPTKLYDIGSQAFGVNENNGVISETSKTGSMVPALMNSYYNYTGVPIVGVSASMGGKDISFWATNGDALNETITRYNTAKTWLESNGYTIRHNYMVWCQGETDGRLATTIDTYKTKLKEVFSEMQKQGIEKSMVIRIGNNRDDATLYDNIIKAQTELCAENDDFVMITAELAGMAEDGLMKDTAHYTQEGYNIAGADAGKNMAYYVNTGMEPYFYDDEYNNYYPFASGSESTSDTDISSYILDVSQNTYDLSSLGTVSDGKLTISTPSSTNKFTLDKTITLTDDASWTIEFVAGNMAEGNTVIASTGDDTSGWIAIPTRAAATAESTACQFRFRDVGNTFQLDFVMPSDYVPTGKHHYAISYDASTKTFKGYVDKVELSITYTKGSQSNISFNDMTITSLLGGYKQTAQNFSGDFYYFAYHNQVLSTTEMYTI